MNWETLLSIGDSLTIGARSYLGYPEYCGAFLSQQTDKHWNVINHSVSGYTTIDIARSIDKNYADLKNIKPDIATILIGTNDLKLNTDPKIFQIAYEQLVTKSRLIIGNTNILLLAIPNLRNGVMLPYNISMNKQVIEYNKIISAIAMKNQLIYMQLNYEDSYFYDGVHLNEAGSESIGKQISERIIELRRN
jgi:lysophospholipase L1-like esterase